MLAPLDIKCDFPLDRLNTFGIAAKARAYLAVQSADALSALHARADLSAMPRLVLGGGSNLLLTRDFPGLVLHMCTRGVALSGEDERAWYVTAAAGENWHRLVCWTLDQGLGGLENLSLIPGCVGAAPIQNIGAYGVELEERFESLRAFDFSSGETVVMNRAACRFGYRDSAFKHALRERAVILDVTFSLPKRWTPTLRYADVAQELDRRGISTPTAAQIGEAVIAIRTRKLPDPSVLGNAGSFFKNPVAPQALRDALLARFPHMVSHIQPDGSFKLAAGWLIDQCGWKGKNLGRAGVYEKQALVLVNRGGASGREIADLAAAIQADVLAKFGVRLEPEPVFV